MIDTVKIYTNISKNIYDTIVCKSVVKTSFSKETGEVFYTIVNGHLEGSYSSSLSVRVFDCNRYSSYFKYSIEIEGSYHKIVKGYNSHNGYYNFYSLCSDLITFVENGYNIVLPNIKHWFVSRVDVAIVFNLGNQDNVKKYINSLCSCNFPRRNAKFYIDESVYFSGSTTTVKVYNKYLEFKKHDISKVIYNTEFNLFSYLSEISGFVRFEVEIKKRKIISINNNCKFARIRNFSYSDFRKIWVEEVEKMLKIVDCDLEIVRGKKRVEERLYMFYSERKAFLLYNFYLSIRVDGFNNVKARTSRSTFYRNIKDLKSVGVDLSQNCNIELDIDFDIDNSYLDFNPFEFDEVI